MTTKIFSTLCVYFLSDNDFFVNLAKTTPTEKLSECIDLLIERFEQIESYLPQDAKEQIENNLLINYKQFLDNETEQEFCKF